ncbi:uncharacterized protein IUM83_14746 [Phytophthora cinnamomi]|uniref:uncharacterized protein n=1 Tax=Phytophthora cinnamomi TaxID=4785 RepID=UPI00355A770D|nr:hypothetical protein IUM83_14746 [Phytophthora cinnamomi]
MDLYERRAAPPAAVDAREFAPQQRRPPFAPAPSFLRPAFPQDERGLRQARHAHTAAAADNLLSLIQSTQPRGGYTQRGGHREESGSTSDEQTRTPPSACRQESSRVVKKRPGRPPKSVAEQDGDAADQPKRKRRDKKPTYIVRREKKAMLEAELVQLKQQVLQLRRASGIPDAFFAEKERLIAKAQDNDRLRAESRKQDMLLRNAHAILSAEYLMRRSESPIETFIHLTADLKQRRAALVNIKEMKLAQADQFITERSKFLPRITPWCQEGKFETEEGHFCAEKMDNTPFHGVRSQDPEEEEDDEYERVVVLTRFFRVKLHHTEMDVPPHVLQEVRQGLACFSDTMVQSMHRVIYESR